MTPTCVRRVSPDNPPGKGLVQCHRVTVKRFHSCWCSAASPTVCWPTPLRQHGHGRRAPDLHFLGALRGANSRKGTAGGSPPATPWLNVRPRQQSETRCAADVRRRAQQRLDVRSFSHGDRVPTPVRLVATAPAAPAPERLDPLQQRRPKIENAPNVSAPIAACAHTTDAAWCATSFVTSCGGLPAIAGQKQKVIWAAAACWLNARVGSERQIHRGRSEGPTIRTFALYATSSMAWPTVAVGDILASELKLVISSPCPRRTRGPGSLATIPLCAALLLQCCVICRTWRRSCSSASRAAPSEAASSLRACTWLARFETSTVTTCPKTKP